MKLSRASDYRSENTRLSESALLSLWAKLGDFQEDIVLVGGLVPCYICRPSADGLEPNTMDVDFGIALAAGGSMYSPSGWLVKASLEKTELSSTRYERSWRVDRYPSKLPGLRARARFPASCWSSDFWS